jgi:hypothetical protein
MVLNVVEDKIVEVGAVDLDDIGDGMGTMDICNVGINATIHLMSKLLI